MGGTKRQHYVPRFCLDHWLSPSGEIAVSIKGKTKTIMGTKDVAVKENLYAFIDLNPAELDFLYRMVGQLVQWEHPIVDLLMVPIFMWVLYLRAKNGDWNDGYKKIYDRFSALPLAPKRRNALNKLLAVISGRRQLTKAQIKDAEESCSSGFEKYESAIEGVAKPIIDLLLQKDADRSKQRQILKDEAELRILLLYIVNQCYRGPEYLKMVNDSLPKFVRDDGGSARLGRYVRYFQPPYVVQGLLKTKNERKVVLIENKTDLEFITADAPYTLYADLEYRKDPIITFFPLSPTRGLFLGYRKTVNRMLGKFGWEVVDRSFIDKLNRGVCSMAQHTIIATSESVLKEHGYYAGLKMSL